MSRQATLSYEGESARSTDPYNATTEPTLRACMNLASYQKALRDYLSPWAALSDVPPGCRTVSFSSWGRFTAMPTGITPSGQLKTSDLCKDHGVMPSFDPPMSEWCYLGVDQPPLDPKYNKALLARDNRQRYRGLATSWETVSEEVKEGKRQEPLRFEKQSPKSYNTNSQIARSLERRRLEGKKAKTLMERLGLVGVTCEELPSAFDSEDEGED